MEPWCKSLPGAPVYPGRYRLADGTKTVVRVSRASKFYAVEQTGRTCRYEPGLIRRLAAELAAGTAHREDGQ